MKRKGLWIQFWSKSLIFWRADLLNGLSHIRDCIVNLVQFSFSVMLKISPMPFIPLEVPLTMIRIQILLVLLLQFNSSPCFLPVSQPAHPGETIPTKLLHGPELIWVDHCGTNPSLKSHSRETDLRTLL